MGFPKYTALSVEETINDLETSSEFGLTNKSVRERLLKYGSNESRSHEVSIWEIFLRQFKSAFIYLLLIASVLTFVLKEYIDCSMILAFVLINVFLGFVQEYKSEKTAKYLKKFTDRKAAVLREGKEILISSSELVPGDIVQIETGDIVSADLRLIKANNLVIDESTLTGESVQIRKHIEKLDSEKTDLYKATNIIFSGTTVVEGKGYAVVVATGKDTVFGKIAKITTETKEVSAFEKQITKFSKFILFLTLITLALVFVVHLVFKRTVSFVDLTVFSVALAVGVIPEAMPLVSTFSLSLGAAMLAKKHVIVKRLSSIEDLGGIQILCSDKTGTITENKLTVADIFSENKEETIKYCLLASSVTNGDITPNNAFDLAIHLQASNKEKRLFSSEKKIYEIPFNPARKRNSVLVKDENLNTLIVRGAPEAIVPFVKNLSESMGDKVIKWILHEGRLGRRTIAIAKKTVVDETYEISDEENNLELIGLISFEDPIKKSTTAAVSKAKSYGVTVKIITGDSPEVAGAVGYKVGIANRFSDVITGEEFAKLKRDEQKEVLKSINVFARVSPEQKYQIIKLLQEDFEVGYLGEGINDAPALKAAGVAIVVDSAADVSREVADIILLKRNLQVIVDGIELGRKTFVNVTNYIKATLASNFGNFYAMVFATLMIDYLPMLPVQILLVNLLSDFPMISIATDRPVKSELREQKNYSIKDILLLATLLGLVSTAFDFMMFGMFVKKGPGVLRTNWFIGSILTELVLIYSIRTRKFIFNLKKMPSIQIIVLTLVAAFFTVYIPLTKFGAEVFQFVKPTSNYLWLLLAIVIAYFLSTETVKRLYYKHINSIK